MKECVVLAAGLSTRMGSWKMMLPWKNGTVLDGTIASALSFCDRVILVTGYRADELRQRYAGHHGVRLCHNPYFTGGMFSSVRCGVAALSGERFFLIPGDMPAVDPQVYSLLWHYPSCGCIQPCHNGGRGHPVLLPAALREIILSAPAESNLRQLIEAYGCESVAVNSQTIHCDLDTPEQYQQLLKASAVRQARTS